MPEWSNFVDADIVNRDKTITFKFRSEIEIFNAYKRASFGSVKFYWVNTVLVRCYK